MAHSAAHSQAAPATPSDWDQCPLITLNSTALPEPINGAHESHRRARSSVQQHPVNRTLSVRFANEGFHASRARDGGELFGNFGLVWKQLPTIPSNSFNSLSQISANQAH